MENKDERLMEMLRSEALATRPPFFPELHRTIMSDINRRARRKSIAWKFTAVAAAFLICLPIGWRISHPRPKLSPITAQIPPAIEVAQLNPATEFRLKGMGSASLWPPQLRVELPLTVNWQLPNPHPEVATEQQGLPETMLGAMEQQVAGANKVLVDQVPGALRSMFSSRDDTFSGTEKGRSFAR